MKKLIPVIALLLCSQYAVGQAWLPENAEGRVRIQDIIEAHEHNKNATIEEDADAPNGVKKEGNDYHYQRWLWYWKQHTDANGYLVSPLKNLEEWRKYQLQNPVSKFARTTVTDMSDWKFQGPDTSRGGYSGLGRINVIAFHPTDANTFWIGSPGGGAWKTTNNGTSWTCMTDMLPVTSVSDIDFNPQNANTVYLCTGDRDASDYYSIGVLKSTNGGASWDTTGLKWNRNSYMLANALIINPLDTNCLMLATNYGIYRSRDGGGNWTQVTTGNFKEILYNPADTSVVYAASSYTYYPTATNAQVYRSTDGGTTWMATTNFTNATRVSIAVTPANPKIVKALVANYTDSNANGLNGIYTSSDSAHTFRLTYAGDCTHNLLGYDPNGNSCTGQGWYDLCIVMSRNDSNRIYVGGVNSWYSTNGGSSWTLMTMWYYYAGVEECHADKHYMAINPLVSGNLYQCNDGGVYVATDPLVATSWRNTLSNGLGITEFYRNAVESNASYVLGGAQDNGTKRVDGPGTYYDIGGGDGMECQIDPTDETVYYYAFQNGSIVKHDLALPGPSYEMSISDNIHSSGAWVTPYLLLPSCNSCILAGYRCVFLSIDGGYTFTAISDSFSSGHIEHLGVTDADVNTMYALADYSDTVYYTKDMGATAWRRLYCPFSSYGNMSGIAVDSKYRNHFWLTFSGYTTTRVASRDSVGGWKDLSQNLPDVPVNCIVQDTSNGYLYIGTDVGIFYRGDTMTMWHPYNNGMPAVRTNDLGINYTTNEIWAATYGRGMWKSAKYTKNVGVSIVPFAADALVVSPNPNHGDLNLRSMYVKNTIATIKIFDNSGRIVWQEEKHFDESGSAAIHTMGLARGTYVVDVSSAIGGIGRQKMVVY